MIYPVEVTIVHCNLQHAGENSRESFGPKYEFYYRRSQKMHSYSFDWFRTPEWANVGTIPGNVENYDGTKGAEDQKT